MKKEPFLLTWLLLSLAAFAMGAPQPNGKERTMYNFNTDWKVLVGDPAGAEAPGFTDQSWKQVTLPWAWNEDEAFKKDIHHLTTAVAWYRKEFKLPTGAKDKKVFLEFEGVRQGGEFYVNGTHIGRHENGAMAVGFDITAFVKLAPAVNVVAVRTDSDWGYREKATNSTYQWSNQNFNANYGGIPKNVFLHVTDKLHQTLPLFSHLKTTGVYVYADNFEIANHSATINAEAEVKNDHSSAKTFEYEVLVEDLDGKKVASFAGSQTTLAPGETKKVTASAKVNNLNFWSWGYGYLYDVYTVLKVDGKPIDKVKTRTGFRKTEFKNGMVYLNDRVLQMKGYAQRTSNEWPAVGMSVPAWLSDFSNRLMVQSNANLVRWMHITPWKQDVESCDRVGLLQAMPAGDAEKDVTGRRWEQRTELMRDAIIYNRNNPSVVFYESGNESISEEHMQEMKSIRDQYDPHGGRAIGSREMLDSKVAEYGGEMLYINKSADIPMWATEYSRDEGLRKYWDEFSPPFHKDGAGPLYKGEDARAYNRNQDSHARENVIRWYDYWEARPGTGKRVNSGGVNIVFSDTNTHYRGEENYRRSGEVDAMRIPKDGYFAHQVMWDGWVEPEKHRTHIMGHWNYAPGTQKDIFVVSSDQKVELFVNGKSQGTGEQSHRFLYTFKNIEWQPGSISAISYGASGQKVSEAKKETAGEPKALRLTVMQHPAGLQANGHDLALVEVEVVDAKGNRCPTALNMINFSLDGPAQWRGGIAQGPDNYILAQSLPVEGGVNRILVRSTTKAGKINVSATAEGLKPATVDFKSKSFKDENGLATVLPGSNLASYLERGPTPAGPSYTVSRVPVAIVKATAGANQKEAAHTFDDNELSHWSNDGRLASGWVNYELEKAAEVSEITMKLNNWRNRSYPIRITVDGKEVFRGNTVRSLGYFTASFAPTVGKNVKIQLTGTNIDGDAFGFVEITGVKEPAGTTSKAKGTLGIVEIEIYEKPKLSAPSTKL
ncbi:sugar-binding domain-containing protein [Rufibacter sp. XAAS-G3-1]|uniref:glycoside hydrolase family 2 protein n=1 Tax=Rufibacter sp. XAAS-G3-1 TaxID=2729134 RepID=UPI0015E7B859|nr:sugar-binding domain-containing protein [Rufibacter sp. XAAS-G3-1]